MKRFICIVLLLMILFPTNVFGEFLEPEETHMERAIVLEVEDGEDDEISEGFVSRTQYVKLKILSGKYKGKIFEIENDLSDNIAYNIEVKAGDKIMVGIEEFADDSTNIYVSDHIRSDHVFILLGIFILLIILIGGKQGVKAVITLGLTIFLVLKVLLPLMLKGINPIPISVAISIIITIVTIFIIGGINSKSISAVIGTSSGVIIAGLIAYIVGSKAKLTGFNAEEATMLMYIPQDIDFDFKALLFSGIILGALGAIMDVGMSIASSIEEIHNANKEISRRELFNAGMNVGKDIMGTMTNTLILAYAGSSIPLLLLFMAYEIPMKEIINLDLIATEIVRSLSGSIGLILTIPLTALIAAFLSCSRANINREETQEK